MIALIRGQKTFLRAPELEDVRIISAWLNDREANKFLQVVYPVSKRYADSFVMEADEDKSKKVFIIDNEDRKPIGIIAMSSIRWESRCCEIGIAIYDRNYRGKGYGRDALSTALRFAFEDMNLHLVYLQVDESNEEARRLYSSLNFEYEGTLRDRYYREGRYRNVMMMSIVNPVERAGKGE